MSQTHKGSLTEALTNILIGFTVNWIANWFILPAYGLHLTARTNFEIGLWYTVVSLIRQYVIRRWFNSIKKAWNHHGKA